MHVTLTAALCERRGSPRAPGHSLTAQVVEWLSEQPRVQFSKEEKRAKKTEEGTKRKKERKKSERRKVGRQAGRMGTVLASDLPGPVGS